MGIHTSKGWLFCTIVWVKSCDFEFYWPPELNSVYTLKPRQNGSVSAEDFSYAFSRIKMLESPLTFLWLLFLGVGLTHWSRVTHICVSDLTLIGSDNGLSLGRRQAIIWTNVGILLIGTLRNKLQWNFNRNSDISIQENAFESVVCEMAAFLSRPQCVNSIPALVQVMACRPPGDRPLSEQMMFSLRTHICVTWPQLVDWICTRFVPNQVVC